MLTRLSNGPFVDALGLHSPVLQLEFDVELRELEAGRCGDNGTGLGLVDGSFRRAVGRFVALVSVVPLARHVAHVRVPAFHIFIFKTIFSYDDTLNLNRLTYQSPGVLGFWGFGGEIAGI